MQKVYKVLKKVANWTDWVAEKILIFLMGVMLLSVLVQIFYRYIFSHFIHYSLPYTEELARYVSIWIVYLGIAVGLKEGIHISFDLLYKKLSPKGQRQLYVLGRIMMLYFISVILIVGWNLLDRISSNISSAMRIPMVWAYSAPWIGSWLVLLRLLVQLLDAIFGFEGQKIN